VSSSDKESSRILESLGVKDSEVPLLLMKNFVVPGARTEKLVGKAHLTFERMSEFLKVYSTAMKQIKQQGLKKKKAAHEEEVAHELTDEASWNSLCPVNGQFVCVVGIHIEDADATMSEFAKLFAKDHLRFLYLPDAKSNVKVFETLKAASSVPALVVVNRKRTKWSIGSPTKAFLDTIVSGSGKWMQEPQLE
jgi:hypothetical protein